MRMILALVAVLYSGAAVAQAASPPAAGDAPVVQAKSKKPAATKGKPQFKPAALLPCLDVEDGTKERLDCYDAVIPPTPKPKAPKAKSVADCRFVKEEDERLACFNGFVTKLPKPPASKPTGTQPPETTPPKS